MGKFRSLFLIPQSLRYIKFFFFFFFFFPISKFFFFQIDSDGNLRAIGSGKTTLKGQLTSRENSVSSCEISVRPISGIQLISPHNNLLVGNEVPVHVIGVSDETPFTFENISVEFSWESSRSDSLAILAPLAVLKKKKKFVMIIFFFFSSRFLLITNPKLLQLRECLRKFLEISK
jgi:hypothetical protein